MHTHHNAFSQTTGYFMGTIFIGFLHGIHAISSFAISLPAFHILFHAALCVCWVSIAVMSLRFAKVRVCVHFNVSVCFP